MRGEVPGGTKGKPKTENFTRSVQETCIGVFCSSCATGPVSERGGQKARDQRYLGHKKHPYLKESIIQMLSDVKDANLTDVFVQVNANGYAYYASDRLPPAVASFDPLGFVLEEAAKGTLEYTLGLTPLPQAPSALLQVTRDMCSFSTRSGVQ